VETVAIATPSPCISSGGGDEERARLNDARGESEVRQTINRKSEEQSDSSALEAKEAQKRELADPKAEKQQLSQLQ
jgi:hypothetical protein